MADEPAKLRIKAGRSGSVNEIKRLLSDLETAYNSIYYFILMVDTLVGESQRKEEMLERRSINHNNPTRFSLQMPNSKQLQLSSTQIPNHNLDIRGGKLLTPCLKNI